MVVLGHDPKMHLAGGIAAGRFADGHGRCKTTSPTTLSRFYNNLPWNTKAVTRAIQTTIVELIKKAYKHTRGIGQVIKARLDLTTLEKTGNFPSLPISVFNAVKGLQIIVLYVGVGTENDPFSYAIWKRPCPLAFPPVRCVLGTRRCVLWSRRCCSKGKRG